VRAIKTTVQKHSGFDKHQKPFRKTAQLYRKKKTSSEQFDFILRYRPETRSNTRFGRKTTRKSGAKFSGFAPVAAYRSMPAAAV
jgi:hypothetical protein